MVIPLAMVIPMGEGIVDDGKCILKLSWSMISTLTAVMLKAVRQYRTHRAVREMECFYQTD